jgi:SAM-dependent methyltransferase
MSRNLRKPPSAFRQPWFAKRVLEVGAGHLPYRGVTHVVDKYPEDKSNATGARSGNLWVPPGVEFREGEFEKLPFSDDEKFDYLYARHVFEHVVDPRASVQEINRLAPRGYIETPSPVYEMLCCSYPFSTSDVHFWFVWSDQARNELHVVKKNERTVGEFSSSFFGQLTQALALAKRADPSRVPDRLLPNQAKTTRLFFSGPIRLHMHGSFEEALARGSDAFECIRSVLPYLRPPVSWVYPRFLPLNEIWSTLKR